MNRRKLYFKIFITILSLCLLIFFVLNNIQFIRNTVGDFLVVICIYSFIKTFRPEFNPFFLASAVFTFAITIEYVQYYNSIHKTLTTDGTFVQLTLGSTFDYMDIIAYFLGLFFIYIFDTLYIKFSIN